MYTIPKKVAVLGAGVMGVRIACHLAQTGHTVLLLDVPKQPNDALLPAQRQLNEAAKDHLKPLYLPEFVHQIQTGDFEADMHRISDCEWIIEAVVEDLKIKQHIYEQVEKYRKTGTLVSSNTSGIPLKILANGRSEDFQRHFFGTHFFNPPRYLTLLELIPAPKTEAAVLDFFSNYATRFLGKEVLFCKDRPAFVANRLGIFDILNTVAAMKAGGFSISEVDALTGELIGKPRSATFGILDLVGLDIFVKVAQQMHEALPEDEQREVFKLPDLLLNLYKKGDWGRKRGQGFYKKVKTAEGTEIHELDPEKGTYALRKRHAFAELEALRAKKLLPDRLQLLLALEGRLGDFFRGVFYPFFTYCSHRLPEIADDVYTVDKALEAGFGWKVGAFGVLHALGPKKMYDDLKKAGYAPADWMETAVKKGGFYQILGKERQAYAPAQKGFVSPPGQEEVLRLEGCQLLWEGPSVKLYDVGDGVFCLKHASKLRILNDEVIEGLRVAVERAEKEAQALLIGAEDGPFSAGADLGLLLGYALEQEYEEIDLLIRQFQQVMLRIRYAKVPVVAVVRELALGGGCELAMHADAVHAQAETYMGLVEMGAGLIPAGGGTKEMAARLSDSLFPQDAVTNRLQNVFETIAMAKISTSAHDAKQLGYLRKTDPICISPARLLMEAKRSALRLAEAGYTPPVPKPIHVQGSAGIALLEAGITNLLYGNYATEHDAKIARKLNHVINGGTLSAPGAVSEAYLLDLEREAFLSLCSEPKSLDRMQHLLRKGKPLRN